MSADPNAAPLRIGAVNYLNSKPLIHRFADHAARCGLPAARLTCDLPSRLADSLAAARFEIALVPVFEALAVPGWRLVSDACVASEGPVGSVKVYFRKPPERVRTLALDEGSRTSAALARLLLANRYRVQPTLERLRIGCGLTDTPADAVLLIGDRAMHAPSPAVRSEFVAEWDLASEWRRDTGLPFVFAVWAARQAVDATAAATLLQACRDSGVEATRDIAEAEAEGLGLTVPAAERYLRENLRFTLGESERTALQQFRTLCLRAGLLTTPAPLR